MAFHHQNTHYYHHQQQQQPLHHQQQQNNNPSCHCGCSSQHPPPPPPLQSSHHPSPFSHCNPPPSSDPLLIQSIVTQILQSSPPSPPSHHHPPSPQCNSIDPLLIQSIVTQILQTSQSPPPPPPPPPENHLYQKFLKPQKQQQKQTPNQEEKRTRSLLKNLHSRIDALESSLHHLSTSSPSSHSHRNQPSLRDFAARIIQIHFRAFLVRRSRTLRYLKDLAFIKSCFNSLKSSLSSNNNNSQVNHSVLSQKALDLLLKLDSVQGGDPMIREGKRSISRDLVKFLQFVDGITVKRQQISSKAMKNVRFQTENNQEVKAYRHQGDSRKVLDKLNQRIQDCYKIIDAENDIDEEEEEDGEIEELHPIDDEQENSRNPNYGVLMKRPDVSVKSKKNVRFADDERNVFIGSSSSQGSDSEAGSIGGGGNDQRQFVASLSRNAEEIIGGFSSKVSEEDDDDDDDEGASQSSNASEGSPREYVKTEVMNNNGSNKQFHNENGNFLFSPPMPVTMDPKIDDLVNRRSNNQRFVR